MAVIPPGPPKPPQLLLAPTLAAKTDACLLLLRERPTALLIVAHEEEVTRLGQAHPDLATRIQTLTKLLDEAWLSTSGVTELILDNADHIFEALTGLPVAAVAFTWPAVAAPAPASTT